LLENRLERRVERLRNFWEHITDRKIWGFTANGDFFRKVREEDG
jgi:NTE family protein